MNRRTSIRLLVSRPGAAALVAVTLAAGASATAHAHEDNAQIVVANHDGTYAYEPANVTIDVGDGVTWSNPSTLTNDAVDHPTQCVPGQSKGTCPWGSEDLPPGGSFEVHFPTSGTFYYFCAVHPYMEGVITVGDGNPPAAPSPTPSSKPSPTPTATVAPGASPTPSASPTPPDATADPTPNDMRPSETASVEPTDGASATPVAGDDVGEGGPSDEPTEDGVTTGDDDDGAPAGTAVPKSIATLLLLGVGTAVLREQRRW